METGLPAPQERADIIGRARVEAALRATMAEGALSHGWLIAAPKGAGKATLTYRIARGLLDPGALEDEDSFQIAPDSRVFRLVAGGAHPDLFVAQRQWNEKTSRYQTEITIETIRALTLFLNRTAALGGFRVAIIDIADELNRNAANALLKALEEPPAKTALLLLAEAPGRLIATIRSRCRRIDLRPVAAAEIAQWLTSQGAASADQAALIAAHAGGRPGYALALANGEGAEAISLARDFLKAPGDVSRYVRALAGKAGDGKWPIFRDLVVEHLSDAARAVARGEAAPIDIASSDPSALLSAWEQISQLCARGEALNLDRAQIITAMAYDLRNALNAA